MFDENLENVALIKKSKPSWQKGKLNGIGGKIEAKETPISAMVREFKEETGVETKDSEWSSFLEMMGINDNGESFYILFFVSIGDLSLLKTVTDEQIVIKNLLEINPKTDGVVDNIRWIAPLALNFVKYKKPDFVRAEYR